MRSLSDGAWLLVRQRPGSDRCRNSKLASQQQRREKDDGADGIFTKSHWLTFFRETNYVAETYWSGNPWHCQSDDEAKSGVLSRVPALPR